jgi:predicted CopG family antitoxin
MSKNISLKRKAYDALKSLQLEGESFSDTILRLKDNFMKLKDLQGIGILSDKEYEIELEEIEAMRANWR